MDWLFKLLWMKHSSTFIQVFQTKHVGSKYWTYDFVTRFFCVHFKIIFPCNMNLFINWKLLFLMPVRATLWPKTLIFHKLQIPSICHLRSEHGIHCNILRIIVATKYSNEYKQEFKQTET